MKPTEVIDFLNEIEEKFPVDQWIVDGIHIWPFLRIQLTFQLDDFVSRPTENITRIRRVCKRFGVAFNVSRTLVKYSIAYLTDYVHNDRPKHKADAVFLDYTADRFFKIKGKWYNVFYEPIANLLEEQNMSSFLLEVAPCDEYRIPRFSKSMFIQPQLTYLGIKNTFIHNKGIVFEGEESFTAFVQFMERKRLGISLPSLLSVKKQVSQIRTMAEYFKVILQKVKPVLGFVMCYYNVAGMAFNLACRELGIVSVDIQHGLQGPLHPAYGRWFKVPKSGYELLPSIFWCWSENEEKTIRKWSDQVSRWHKPVVAGNLILNMFREEDNELVKCFDREVLRIKEINKRSIHVLVTLATGRGMPDLIRHVITASPDSWFWWVRLHPGMMSERKNISNILTTLNTKNVNLDEASDLPLYAILRHVDVHVTETSSVVIEADLFGVNSVIISKTGTEYFAEYLLSGKAIAANTPQDLIKAIKRQVEKMDKKRMILDPKIVFNTDDLGQFISRYCNDRV